MFEATEFLERESVSIVLLDLSLPDSHGYKTMTVFQERFPKLPVVAMVSIGEEALGLQAIRAGAQDYLVKTQFNAALLSRVIRNVLQKQKAQEIIDGYAKKLAISEKRYQEAQEMAKFGNWEVDLVSNQMSWSDEVFRIFDLPKDERVPTFSDYLQFIVPDDRELFEQAVALAGKDGNVHKIEYRVQAAGKAPKFVVNQLKLNVESSSGRFYLAGVVQDISDRRASEQIIEAKNLSQSTGKLREEVLSGMSFQLRTPLNTLVNLVYLLARTPLSAQQEDYLEAIKSSVDDMSGATSNLLNLSMLVADKVRVEQNTFKLRDFVQALQRTLQQKINGKKVVFKLDVEEDLPEQLFGDSNKLYQILYNLLDNALLHVPNDGRILLKIKTVQRAPQQIKLLFAVKDNGAGSSQEEILRMLDPQSLFTLNNSEDDTQALNIPVAKRLTDSLSGELTLESRAGNGTTAELRLSFGLPKEKTDQGALQALHIKSMRVLLVEDHFLNQIATKKVLSTWMDGVDVDIADNGKIALEKIAKSRFDVVLMDLQMPVMGGMEALSEIRKTSNLPVIALTASASPQESSKCLAAGFNAYLAKPYRPQELYEKILSVIGGH